LRLIDKFWLAWFCLAFFSFLIPELYFLFSGRPDRTLSYAIWRLIGLKEGQGFWQWSFGHYFFMACFGMLIFWLFFHFGWGLFR